MVYQQSQLFLCYQPITPLVLLPVVLPAAILRAG